MGFAKLLSSVLLAVQLCGLANASPTAITGQDAAPKDASQSLSVAKFFHPDPHYETYGAGTELPDGVSKSSIQDTVSSFVQHKLGVSSDQVEHQSGFSSDVADHAYLHQVHNGIPFKNAVANVALKDGKVVAFGSSFVKPEKIADSTPKVDGETAVKAAEAALGATRTAIPPKLEYLVQPSGNVALVHSVQVKNEDSLVWGEAYVDAFSGQVVSFASYISQASYKAVPFTKASIANGQSVISNPQDTTASPNGWHTTKVRSYTTTQGNNAISVNDRNPANTAGQSSAGLNFIYDWNSNAAPTTGNNPSAARTNAFYLVNKIHDFLYRYGFTEKSFNFQDDNSGKGGQDGDKVIISVQDPSRTDNASFGTPADGQSPVMYLHLFYNRQGTRDSAMDNGVMAHEFGHGLTNRLVGGGTASCLGGVQSGGLGEGWGDMLADWIEQISATTKDFVIGAYVYDNPGGFRQYPYSTNAKTNPLKFSSLNGREEPHAIGEVWANTLHNVYAALVTEKGFASDAAINPDAGKGNTIFMRLFIDSLATAPCNPSVLHARDAWITADQTRYNGAHKCTIYRAFASRGLGTDASSNKGNFVDGFKVPSGC